MGPLSGRKTNSKVRLRHTFLGGRENAPPEMFEEDGCSSGNFGFQNYYGDYCSGCFCLLFYII